MTVEEFRKKVNEINEPSDLEWLLSLYGKLINGKYYKYITFQDANHTTIGFNDNSLYILEGKEMFYFSQDGLVSTNAYMFILDNVLGLNTDDEFYKLYFKACGYQCLLDETKSPTVKDIIKRFIDNKCSVVNIFTTDDYTSVTVSGRKRNNSDFEYRVIGTTKEDVIELVTLLRIKPYINKKDIFDAGYIKPDSCRKPSTQDIIDSYNDYKDCNYDDSININNDPYDDMKVVIHDEDNYKDTVLILQSDDDYSTEMLEDSYGLKLKLYNHEEELWMYSDLPESFDYEKFINCLYDKRYVDLSDYSFFRME